jgi:hypothetical protein
MFLIVLVLYADKGQIVSIVTANPKLVFAIWTSNHLCNWYRNRDA